MYRSLVRLAALAAVFTSTDAATLPSDLAKAAKEFDEAQMHSNGKALRELLANDYLLANGHGGVENKAQFIADYTASGFHLDPYVIREPIERVWSDGAVLGGVVTLKGRQEIPGRASLRGRLGQAQRQVASGVYRYHPPAGKVLKRLLETYTDNCARATIGAIARCI